MNRSVWTPACCATTRRTKEAQIEVIKPHLVATMLEGIPLDLKPAKRVARKPTPALGKGTEDSARDQISH